MLISKSGWCNIGEAIIVHTNLVFIERPIVKEDTYNIEEVKENKVGICI